jgi:hypothetical protein
MILIVVLIFAICLSAIGEVSPLLLKFVHERAAEDQSLQKVAEEISHDFQSVINNNRRLETIANLCKTGALTNPKTLLTARAISQSFVAAQNLKLLKIESQIIAFYALGSIESTVERSAIYRKTPTPCGTAGALELHCKIKDFIRLYTKLSGIRIFCESFTKQAHWTYYHPEPREIL